MSNRTHLCLLLPAACGQRSVPALVDPAYLKSGQFFSNFVANYFANVLATSFLTEQTVAMPHTRPSGLASVVICALVNVAPILRGTEACATRDAASNSNMKVAIQSNNTRRCSCVRTPGQGANPHCSLTLQILQNYFLSICSAFG